MVVGGLTRDGGLTTRDGGVTTRDSGPAMKDRGARAGDPMDYPLLLGPPAPTGPSVNNEIIMVLLVMVLLWSTLTAPPLQPPPIGLHHPSLLLTWSRQEPLQLPLPLSTLGGLRLEVIHRPRVEVLPRPRVAVLLRSHVALSMRVFPLDLARLLLLRLLLRTPVQALLLSRTGNKAPSSPSQSRETEPRLPSTLRWWP